MSHYEVLGALPTAEYAEIRSKYRAAILALHPDKITTHAPSGLLQSAASNDLNFLSNQSADDKIPSSTFVSKIKELGLESQFKSTFGGEFRISKSDAGVEDVLSRFLRVQNAWEVLRDPNSRAKYDRFLSTELLNQELNSRDDSTRIIAEEVLLQEMNLSCVERNLELEYSYPCRCGDFFVVSQNELRHAGLMKVESDKATSTTTKSTKQSTGSLEDVQEETCCRDRDGKAPIEQACTGASLDSNPSVQWNSNSLVLPCQSCSLNIRLHLS